MGDTAWMSAGRLVGGLMGNDGARDYNYGVGVGMTRSVSSGS